MYLLLLGIFAIIASVVLFFFYANNKKLWNKQFEKLCIALFSFGLLVILIFGICCARSNEIRETNLADYNQLTIYQPLVEATDNELIRFNYYEQVNAWNERYESYMEKSDNPWTSVFYRDLYRDCDFIDFQLRGE